MDSRGGYRLATALWFLWAAAVLIFYYARFGELFAFDPKGWEESGHSLAAVPQFWGVLTAGPSAWGLPAFNEAFSRALAAFFGSALVLGAAHVLGAVVCRLLRWHPDDWREGLLYQTGAGLGILGYCFAGLGLFGLYYPAAIKLLIAIILVGGCVWLYFFPERPRRRGAETTFLHAHSRMGDRVWQGITLPAVLIALAGALAPEKEYDTLRYHLGFPKLWLEHGRLVDVAYEFVSFYAMTWESLFGVALAMGGPVAAKLLHFACLPFLALLTYQSTLRFFPRASPWLAVAIFVTIPTVLWEATTSYNDLALAMHAGLTVYALLRYVEGRSRQWLALAALNLGLALATKHLALFVLALATSGLALRLWLADRRPWRALMPALMLGLSSLVVALPWYIRSWAATGNPVFPELFGIFGAPPERWSVDTQRALEGFIHSFGRPRTALNLLTLPWDMTVHAAPYGGTFGAIFLLLLPALALLRRRSHASPWFISFTLLYLALWATPISSFQFRYLVPVTPMLAVLAAEACNRLALVLRTELVRWARPAFYVGVAVLLLMNLPPFTSLHEVDRVQWKGWLNHVIHRVPIEVVIGRESQDNYLLQAVPSYGAWRYINANLPADARVLTFSSGDHFYSHRERLWSDATIAASAAWSQPGREGPALQALRDLGISHVLLNKRRLEKLGPGVLAIAQPVFIADQYELEYEDGFYILYRLRVSGPSRTGSDNFYK